MNEYRALRDRQQQEFNNFPLKAAFGDEQFERMMQEWGFNVANPDDFKKVAHVYGGMYIRKIDIPAFKEMTARHYKEMEDAIAADETGEGFVYQMFYDELCNHEYGYTGDTEDALDALGYTAEEVVNTPKLKRGIEKAVTQIHKEEGWL